MDERGQELKRFVKDFGDRILRDEAALFVGAGLSVSAGYVDWRNLLRPIAESLGLDIAKETDLLSIPQYEYNKTNSKHNIRQTIMDSLVQDVSPSVNHEIIARLPIETIWTTNYDNLIEHGFQGFGKKLDIKIDNGDVSLSMKDADATLYKMHGSLSNKESVILLKQDYEEYEATHNLFSDKLRGDFLDKTFLFLGYGFSDPNISAIIARVSSQGGANKRIHYCITRIPDDKYSLIRYKYECRERQRYGIQTIGVRSYEEVPKLLTCIETYITKNNVFLSGADVLDSRHSKINLNDFCRQLGYKLIINKYNLVSGFGLGIAEGALLAAYRAVAERSKEVSSKQLCVYPFPRGEVDKKQVKEKFNRHRQALLSMSGVVIVVAGNKKENDSIISSYGVREEVDMAKSLGRYIIPIGATGDVAAEICNEALKNPDEFLHGITDVKGKLQLFQDSDSIDTILDTIFLILKEVKEKESFIP